jgi:hypothetical protein
MEEIEIVEKVDTTKINWEKIAFKDVSFGSSLKKNL